VEYHYPSQLKIVNNMVATKNEAKAAKQQFWSSAGTSSCDRPAEAKTMEVPTPEQQTFHNQQYVKQEQMATNSGRQGASFHKVASPSSVAQQPGSNNYDEANVSVVPAPKHQARVSPMSLPGDLHCQQHDGKTSSAVPMPDEEQDYSEAQQPLYLQSTMSDDEFGFLAFAYTAKSVDSNSDNGDDIDQDHAPSSSSARRSPVPPPPDITRTPIMSIIAEDSSFRELKSEAAAVSDLPSKKIVPVQDLTARQCSTVKEEVVEEETEAVPVHAAKYPQPEENKASYPPMKEFAAGKTGAAMTPVRRTATYQPKPKEISPIQLMMAKPDKPKNEVRRLTKNHPNYCGQEKNPIDEEGVTGAQAQSDRLNKKQERPSSIEMMMAEAPVKGTTLDSQQDRHSQVLQCQEGPKRKQIDVVVKKTPLSNAIVSMDETRAFQKTEEDANVDDSSSSKPTEEGNGEELKRPVIPGNAKKLPSMERRMIRLNSMT
jgi:hypothetical protein